MTIETIIVKKLYVNQGTTKQGKPYTLRKFLSTTRLYYSTFAQDSIASSIKEGDTVTLECEPAAGHEGSFSIKRIIEVASQAGSSPNQGQVVGGRPASPTSSKADAPMTGQKFQSSSFGRLSAHDGVLAISEPPYQAASRIVRQAKEILAKDSPGLEDYNDYAMVLAETIRTLSVKESEAYEVAMLPTKIKAFGKQ
jgi:hypothetical protein